MIRIKLALREKRQNMEFFLVRIRTLFTQSSGKKKLV